MIKNDPNYKGHFYYQVLHHVQSMEKLRIVHNVSGTDFDQLVQTMTGETRRENVKNQSRLL